MAVDVADWRSVVIYDAARATGLLDALPATLDETVQRTGLQRQAVRAVLDALTSYGIVVDAGDGRWTLGPAAPDESVAAQLSQHAMSIRRWSTGLEARLQGDKPPKTEPFRLRDWLASMALGAEQQAETIIGAIEQRLAAPDGTSLRALDLGGGHGRLAAALAGRGFEVVLADRPDVLAVVAEERWLDGTDVTTVALDFHESLPEGPFDVIVAAGVMHTMPSETASKLLRRLAATLSTGGLIVIRTTLRNTSGTNPLFAIQMLIASHGGDAHRLEDYDTWLKAADMTEPEVIDLETGSLLVSRRR